MGAQTSGTFTVAAMNVDGLPAEINLVVTRISLNPDSKGSAGAQAISQKLATKDYDIVGLSEDFNYHGSLISAIGDKYNVGTHRGSIDASNIASALFNDATLDTDGLGLLWKKDIQMNYETWTRWNQWNGKTDQGADGLIKKGYRYYLATLPGGEDVDLYILHMDAETNPADIAARESQMDQLASDILANPSTRPKIVFGDTNCRYTRDKLKSLFVDRINADPRYTIHDAWVEKNKQDTYPTYGTNDLLVGQLGYNQGEIVDKILYINPSFGLQLKLRSFKVDTDFNGEDGEPLADHYPVVATFSTEGVLYDPWTNWHWTDQSDTEKAAYTEYTNAFNLALPYTQFPLPEDMQAELQRLLTAKASAQGSSTSDITILRQRIEAWIVENHTTSDMTRRIINPSFELGKRLTHGSVQGWTVATDAEEAFISGVLDNDEGASIRDFTPHDGNYVFNTWGGTPANGYFCLQDVSLLRGIYRLSVRVASDAWNQVTLRCGDVRVTSEPLLDRHVGYLLEAYFYHSSGKTTIGLESNTWFEADDFQLVRYTQIQDAIDSPSQASDDTLPTAIYAPDGSRRQTLQRGINIVRTSDHKVHKVFIK